MSQKIQGTQRDFSFGEVDIFLKRSDESPARKNGLRQMANMRILNSGALQDRPGRRALYPVPDGGLRTERFAISAGKEFDIQFAVGRVKIIDPSGATVANFATQAGGFAWPWDANSVNNVVYTIFGLSIYITAATMRPAVITFDGVSTWSITQYNEATTIGGQKRTPFYRLSPENVTMLPSATRGAITVQFSSPIVVAGMVGTRIRWAGRQLLLGSVIDSSNMNATVIEPLPPAQILTVSASVGNFTIGDEVIGELSGARGIVATSPTTQLLIIAGFPSPNIGDTVTGGTSGAVGTVVGFYAANTIIVSLNGGTAFVAFETITGAWGSVSLGGVSTVTLVVQLIQSPTNATTFAAVEKVSGPSGTVTTSAIATTTPQAISVWDDEVFNGFRGYPASCFTDQFRLGFCNFPSIPGAIAWSAINSPTDLYGGANPSDGIFEIAPGKVQVYYVVPGPESSEFVVCDRRIYYIPISPTNPLRPGSVQFLLLSGDGGAQVQPRIAQEAILYVNAGQNSVMAIIATGAYFRPFNTKNLSEFHAHLFNNIQCIAAPSADGTFNERYAYVLNGNGSIAVGKYSADSLPSNQPVIGWGPWSGGATVSWIGAYAADVVFTSSYFGTRIVEILDDAQYLDAALAVNALPAAFTPPGGKGPLWWIPNQSVSLIDQVTRSMGTYQIDANGFIVPQFNDGEDLTVASLIAGQSWTATVEPFCPDAPPGADAQQRMRPRRIARFAAYAVHSTGFVMGRLFSGTTTPTSPAQGALMAAHRFPSWNQGDDPTLPPPQREITERIRPVGRSYDPRVVVIKDVPGPLQILELGIEVTN